MTTQRFNPIQVSSRDVVASVGGFKLIRWVFKRTTYSDRTQVPVKTKVIPASIGKGIQPKILDWIDIRDATKRYGLDFQWLFDLVQDELIESRLQGKKILVSEKSVDLYVQDIEDSYYPLRKVKQITGLSIRHLRKIAKNDIDAVKLKRRWYMHPELVRELQ